mgnify:CR=1 FL=1
MATAISLAVRPFILTDESGAMSSKRRKTNSVDARPSTDYENAVKQLNSVRSLVVYSNDSDQCV